MVAKRKGVISPEQIKERERRQRYILAWYLIGFWCLHFIASAVFSKEYYHPVTPLVSILNYSCVGAMLFLGGDEALRVLERVRSLKAGQVAKGEKQDGKQTPKI